MNTHFAEVIKTIGGLEMELEVEFKVTSWGSCATWDDPGDSPEIEIISIKTYEGRDLTKLCAETRDLWGQPSQRFGLCRFHSGVYTPTKWVRGEGYVATGPRQGMCHTEHGLPTLESAIYEEIVINHMPDREVDYYF